MSARSSADLTPVDWALLPWRRFAEFSGRSPRAEYWWYVVGVGVLGFLLGLLDALVLHMRVLGNYGPLGLFFNVMMVVPSLAVLTRRLHDADHSGWWAILKIPSQALILLGKNPLRLGASLGRLPNPLIAVLVLAYGIAGLILLVFVVTEGTNGPNAYGPDPYGANALEEVFA